jgi:hypothetical protein
MASEAELSPLEMFSTGVPPGAVLQMSLDGLRKLTSAAKLGGADLNVLMQISFVGAVSYFEAFFKDHFGAILNNSPDFVRLLARYKPDLSIDPTKLLEIEGDVRNKLGFLLSEQLDFGTPQKINAVYSATLKLTPFSKAEAQQFSDILRDRNLIVHHGGVYTSSYLNQFPKIAGAKALPFWDSKMTSLEEVLALIEFAERIARKTLKASKQILVSSTPNPDTLTKGALDLIDYGFD